VGDATFFPLLRAWFARNKYSNVTTSDFIALAERRSGQDLDRFFRAWLFKEGRPESW
jgi:aminopeptidase N